MDLIPGYEAKIRHVAQCGQKLIVVFIFIFIILFYFVFKLYIIVLVLPNSSF